VSSVFRPGTNAYDSTTGLNSHLFRLLLTFAWECIHSLSVPVCSAANVHSASCCSVFTDVGLLNNGAGFACQTSTQRSAGIGLPYRPIHIGLRT